MSVDDGRRLIAAYRARTVPDEAKKAALLERLCNRPEPAAWPRVAVSAALALAIAAAVLLLLRGALSLVGPPARERSREQSLDDVRTSAAVESVAVAPTSPASTVAPPQPETESIEAPEQSGGAPRSFDPTVRPRVGGPAQPESPPATSSLGSIAEEAKLLAAAQAALRDADPAGALAVLEEHARRFPQGSMQIERTALRAIASCGVARTADALSRARDVLADARATSYGTRIRHACGL